MRSVWAVATNTIRQVLRLKIAVVFILLLAVLLPIMGAATTGDSTIKGRLQTFISYGLSLTSLLLSILTIVTSVYSLTSDLEQKQIYTVLTKPIRRFQLLVGKLLGVVLLNTALLAIFSVTIYVITFYTPRFFNVSEGEFRRLENEFFTARIGLIPIQPDVTKEAADTYARLEKNGRLDEIFQGVTSRKQIIEELTNRLQLEKRAAAPGHDLIWEFNNVKPLDPNQNLFIKFKYDVSVNPPNLQVYSEWRIGDIRQIPTGKIETPIYSFERKDLIRTSYEIEVPADSVADDGYLAVGFLNPAQLNNTVVIFPPEDGLEVLYKADTFTANFIRAVLLILVRLIFLACLGILASSFLSFPVAVLFCLVILLTGTVSGFIIESFDSLGGNVGKIYSYTIKPMMYLLPQFDKYNPSEFLVSARLLSWSLLAEVTAVMICIKAVLLLILALVIFNFREIAKVIV